MCRSPQRKVAGGRQTRGTLPNPLLFHPGQGHPAGHRAAPKLHTGQSTAGDRTRLVPDATRIGSFLPEGTPSPVPSQPHVLPEGAAAASCFPSR